MSVDWNGARLHLGCGRHHLENWVNADGLEGPGIDCVIDAHQDLHEIPDNSLTWVYNCHFLEHLFPNLVPGILKHLHRVLQPGGKLTIATTDLIGIITNAFLSNRYGHRFEDPLFGQTGSTDHPFAAHRDVFTYGKLEGMLKAAGFANVRRWAPEEYSEIADLGDYSTSARDVSVYVEGLKL